MRSAAYINSKLTSPYLSLKYYTIDDVFNILHALKFIFHKTKMFSDYYGTIVAKYYKIRIIYFAANFDSLFISVYNAVFFKDFASFILHIKLAPFILFDFFTKSINTPVFPFDNIFY